MSNEILDTSPFFEVIPPLLCEPDQVPRWYNGGEALTYKLLREPWNLEELNKYKHCLAIWRDNSTLTYVTPQGSDNGPINSALCLAFLDNGPTLNIAGNSNVVAAATAAYFVGFDCPTEGSSHLVVESMGSRKFYFYAAGSRCFTKIFKVAPSRPVTLTRIQLSGPLSITLATRLHTADLSWLLVWRYGYRVCRCTRKAHVVIWLFAI